MLSEIKQQFFMYRNGVVADALRKGGVAYDMVFGVNLVQLKEIASGLPHTAQLAEELWADRRTRESMMLAPMLYPVEELAVESAVEMLTQAPTAEVVDVLCHALLRRMPRAWEVAAAVEGYPRLRLLLNIMATDPVRAAELARDQEPRELSQRIIQEAKFLNEGDSPEVK